MVFDSRVVDNRIPVSAWHSLSAPRDRTSSATSLAGWRPLRYSYASLLSIKIIADYNNYNSRTTTHQLHSNHREDVEVSVIGIQPRS